MRPAVLPVAAWTMRRRPALAERTRRLAAGIVSAATWSLSFASTDVDPALGRYVDAMIAGTPVDVIAEFYPALAGLDETGALEPLRRVPTLVLTGDADKMIPKAHSESWSASSAGRTIGAVRRRPRTPGTWCCWRSRTRSPPR